jgi:hypothetical protein
MELFGGAMKKLLQILFLFIFIGLQAQPDSLNKYYKQSGKYLVHNGNYFVKPNDTIYILGVLGQSNALAEAGNETTLYIPYQGLQSKIMVVYDGNYLNYPQTPHLEYMNPCENTVHRDYTDPTNPYHTSVGWGVEQRCAHRFQAYKNTDIVVIKSAYGGVSEAYFFDGYPGMTDFLNYFNAAITGIKALGKIPKFVSIVWLQGESNSVNPDYYYEGNTEYIVNYIRTYSPYLANVNFTFIKLSSELDRPTDNKAIINNAFVTCAANKKRCYVIDTDSLGTHLQGDHLHYTATSLNLIGEAWFNLIK